MTTYLSGASTPEPRDVTPHVLRIVAECVPDLLPRQGEMAFAFHQRMVESVPLMSRMVDNGWLMCQRLIAVMLYAVQLGPGGTQAITVVQQMGRDSYLAGFPVEQYHSLIHAVLYTVRERSALAWSSSLSSAWVEYLMWFLGHLQIGADAQRACDADQASHSGLGGDVISQVDPMIRQDPEPPAPPPVIIEDDFDEDEDEDESSYGSLMMSMTLDRKKDKRDKRGS